YVIRVRTTVRRIKIARACNSPESHEINMTTHSSIRLARACAARVILVALTSASALAAQNPTNPQFPRNVALGPRTTYQPKTSHGGRGGGSFRTAGRNWWDVTFYDLRVAINPSDSSIRGSNGITYKVLKPGKELQIDLMVPLEVDSMVQDKRALTFRRDSNAFFATMPAAKVGERKTITVYYHVRLRIAKNPRWHGRVSLQND